MNQSKPVSPLLLGEVAAEIMLAELERGCHIDSDLALFRAQVQIADERKAAERDKESS